MKQLLATLLKYASLPLALLYGIIIFIRNKFYDLGIFSSMNFSLPVICIGNITVGGTGKSPHIEYLIELLFTKYQVATLSRGYKRRSRGFRLAKATTDAREIGDEPFQFKSKYPQVEVCVAEERMTAIPQLLQLKPQVQVILLDDAYQHRTVKAGVNILLTDYERLYTRDFIMPFGLLRESRKASIRASIIIVTKCPINLSEQEKQKLIAEINPISEQQVYFTSVVYKNVYPINSQSKIEDAKEVLLVTGIANPLPLKQKLQEHYNKVYSLPFQDHHYFTTDDIEEIKQAFDHISNPNKIIITTEKDASRLMLHQEKLQELQLPIYVQQIGIQFLFNEATSFNEHIENFIQEFYPDIIIEDEQEIAPC